jgi:hypothetical protein
MIIVGMIITMIMIIITMMTIINIISLRNKSLRGVALFEATLRCVELSQVNFPCEKQCIEKRGVK